ncbi:MULTISPECIES: helix-turn-helix domain-containing protein [Tenacibaculum]|uniref:Helix-turn-helix domain-containing protein n=1 Tax=Tenacibaculum aiptasiae TaxID=426481 RepID=A0A7J5AAH8_9FLAO|nr:MULTISPECIES: AraC family transcriptional regulator [Tenacibaculum]KAB1154189.1 helix-turn-helix domain-containing protein [Tenacibaculum aiptasiae]MCF2876534.1 AraC family transcriptional regulator [Tenacibaculum sp. Cn5-1]MCF2936559.1 AraC family transcriptional regulator [Tenacibaculum sp. Cn5-34]MCG7511848.1 AraC family transcriptional regulator [Tenacibaculum sp. Cn5-46]
MRKKEFTDLPIRSFEDNAFTPKQVSKFEIDRMTGENNGNQIIVEPHRHDYYHIMFIKKGIGKHSIDFKTYDIKPNMMFFVSPGQVHSIETSIDTEGYVISFDSGFYHLGDSFQKLLDFPFFHSISNSPIINIDKENTKIQAAWDELYEEYNASTNDKNNILRALFEILLIRSSRIYDSPTESEKPAYLTYQLRKLETLIDRHFKELRLLNDYADLMHISPRHLNNLCKKGLNKTVMNLIHERTLTEAKRLLLFTNNSISEIAYELGFTDTSYFMRFFKKHTSLTADTYRNQNNIV